MDAAASPRIELAQVLSDSAADFWELANKQILWGWKRDVGDQSRAVYFSGDLAQVSRRPILDRFFFHYAVKLHARGSDPLLSDLDAARTTFQSLGIPVELEVRTAEGISRVLFRMGVPTPQDLDRTRRLQLRRPRRSIAVADLPDPTVAIRRGELTPADLYVGSGISYEAGLPTLCDVHDIFGVDDHASGSFMVGARDWLPGALAREGTDRLKLFCRVHLMALEAQPTKAMQRIRRLFDAGRIGRIFTDNVDNILGKVSVPFERVRGSGVFNERYETSFESPTLIVVGVAADRRQIIRQARAAGLNIAVVNPCQKVSPNVTHLEYVRKTDTFFRTTAQDFFAGLHV
jgi:hypothetical protein